MDDTPDKPFQSASLWACLAVAAVVGFLCLVIPPHLITRPNPQAIYATTLIPWFGTAAANLEFKVSAGLLLVLGLALGIAQPKQPLLIGFAAVSLFLVVHTINVANDLAMDKTSHNLLPFEYVMFGVMAVPAMVGARGGAMLRKQLGVG